MKNVLGMNNLPRMVAEYHRPHFDALNIGHIRFHDAALENPARQLVDISRIFPLFHLDDSKEENYFFTDTDNYFSYITNDAEIEFKLGECIDHTKFKIAIGTPADIDKWARVCRNVIGHYKNGEMNGMHLNITRVSVWEEPGNPACFGGSVEDYAKMFCAAYRAIKKDFPDVKFGGPALQPHQAQFLEDFISLCAKEGIKPDFISATYYYRSIDALMKEIAEYYDIMKRNGLTDAKFSLAEHHYGPTDWGRVAFTTENGFVLTESASYTSSSLIDMIDVDYIDTAYYYSWGTNFWGVADRQAPTQPMLPVYYGLLFFQALATQCERISVSTDNAYGARILAGKTPEGKLRLLISCHEVEDCRFVISGAGASVATLKMIHDAYDLESGVKGKELFSQNGVFEIEHTNKYGVYLLEI
jgi:hypothetical protein